MPSNFSYDRKAFGDRVSSYYDAERKRENDPARKAAERRAQMLGLVGQLAPVVGTLGGAAIGGIAGGIGGGGVGAIPGMAAGAAVGGAAGTGVGALAGYGAEQQTAKYEKQDMERAGREEALMALIARLKG